MTLAARGALYRDVTAAFVHRRHAMVRIIIHSIFIRPRTMSDLASGHFGLRAHRVRSKMDMVSIMLIPHTLIRRGIANRTISVSDDQRRLTQY